MDELRLDIRKDFLTCLWSDRVDVKCEWNPAILRWLMDASNTSTCELSDGTGIKLGSLHQYQYGKACPSLYTAVKIADYFRVPVDFLLGRCTVNECGEIFGHYADYFKELRDAALDAYLINKYAQDDSMTTQTVSVYPFNLMEAILWSDHNECIEFCEDGLEAALAHLNERERALVDLRYRKEMTLDEISEEVQLGRERVRQIIAKACRKLRHPSCMRLIRYGNLGTEKLDELKRKEAELLKREAELNQLADSLKEKAASLGSVDEEKEEETEENSVLDYPIEWLDLTVRSYNCLKRVGINTVRNAAERAAKGDIHHIRNMGVRSTTEVLSKLKDIGYDYFDLYSFGRSA